MEEIYHYTRSPAWEELVRNFNKGTIYFVSHFNASVMVLLSGGPNAEPDRRSHRNCSMAVYTFRLFFWTRFCYIYFQTINTLNCKRCTSLLSSTHLISPCLICSLFCSIVAFLLNLLVVSLCLASPLRKGTLKRVSRTTQVFGHSTQPNQCFGHSTIQQRTITFP